ncbi:MULTISPECIES: hypothetical protein [Bacillaceae]|uniref:hypothetical protein n=1 Tax=Bacillaceae TaxID=186817 RepID=UPI001E51F62C|nr:MULTISPECIES: hypothetical protein [Bacillaceae]MCE4047458.1 hypothetical protein [Bacillus sp. Au-Bac7]MCM3030734.1 hypothetical protein [Niallia sp. MER 6]MDL0435848.1 hypothetical protein [Niallia sp. SS-2023]UPO86192.1 hypothetical protein L8T27_011230 [Niallia sp. Man26]
MEKKGCFDIKVNHFSKTIDMLIEGTFDPSKVFEFVTDYKNKMIGVPVKEYRLIIDCKNMDVLTQEMIPYMENSFRLYKEFGVERMIIIIQKSPVLRMQLKRIATRTGLLFPVIVEI